MRIESVTAHSFGPLRGETLTFGPGLTIVFGPNESAKSSWHSATFAAMCGRPSGRQNDGGGFERRHRPWDGGDWLVETTLSLDDGRRVRLRQNLANRADRQATDLTTGEDLAADITHHGAPDAAHWLHLDRDSFRATASVAQADILHVRDSARGLQTFLQRAAATAGTGPPIDAITRLTQFQAEHVGSDRTRRKPLQLAPLELAEATSALAAARVAHTAYEARLVEATAAGQVASLARAHVVREEWASATDAAADLRARADSASALTAALAELADATGPTDPTTAATVAEALFEWKRVQEADRVLAGSGTTVLDDEPVVAVDAPGGLTDDEFWRLVSDLQVRLPQADPGLVAAEAQTRHRWTTARNMTRWLVSGGVVAVAVGAGMAAVGPTPFGLVLVGLGVLAGLVGLVATRGRTATARMELDQAVADLAASSGAVRSATAVREAAAARCAAAGLPADPEALRALAISRERQLAARDQARGGHDDEKQRAGGAILNAAARAGLSVAGLSADLPAEVAWSLAQWQEHQAADAERRHRAHGLDQRLAAELRGSTLPELVGMAHTGEARAQRLRDEALVAFEAAGVDPGDPAGTDLVDYLATRTGDPQERLAGLRARAGQAEADAIAAANSVNAPAGSVSEAEERVAAAEAEVARVNELQETLNLTLTFLRDAQQRAHRTIAPRLNESMKTRLPAVTGQRYTEVTVDPETLTVRVWGPGGAPREADVLSFGTAEQIFLLLRIALAEQLVPAGLSCPLIFDDVTVHADRDRTHSILDLLLAESRHRQIIIFSQQEQVRDWAREHLTGDRHALRELPPVTTV